jgi:cytidylate kinase
MDEAGQSSLVITIDGPAGAGKSTAARELARRLRLDFLDTGAMYRAVTLASLRAHVAADDEERLEALLRSHTLELPSGRVLLNGEDVTAEIRTPEVTAATGQFADNPRVRLALAHRQRVLAVGRRIVCEGRDQGTIVFPDAVCKFFLIADPVVRASRRYREMAARGQAVDRQAILAAQEQRDRRDRERGIAPLRPADDAIIIDTTDLTFEAMVARLEEEIRRCTPGL